MGRINALYVRVSTDSQLCKDSHNWSFVYWQCGHSVPDLISKLSIKIISAFTKPGIPSVSKSFLTATINCENENSERPNSAAKFIDNLFESLDKKASLPSSLQTQKIKNKKTQYNHQSSRFEN